MSLLIPPILTPTKVKAYSLVEVYKLKALCACYPALKPKLEPIIKFCEKAQRKFMTDAEYDRCRKEGSVDYLNWQHGANLHKEKVVKEAVALLSTLGEVLPDNFFARFRPPVDHTIALSALDDRIAEANKDLRAMRQERARLLEEAGLADTPQKELYMRSYMRRRRAQMKAEKTNV